jgi:hypothetical protein
LGLQLAELILHVMPAAIAEMARAFAGFITFTLTGRYEVERQDRRSQ